MAKVRLFPYRHDLPLAHPAGVTVLYEVPSDMQIGRLKDDFLSVALPGREPPMEHGEDDEWAKNLVPVVAKFDLQQDLRQARLQVEVLKETVAEVSSIPFLLFQPEAHGWAVTIDLVPRGSLPTWP